MKGGYFEGNLCRRKTSRTLEKQTRFLPIIPVSGLLRYPWLSAFLDRRQLGLDDIHEEAPVTTDVNFILVPSQWTAFNETKERMGAAELSERLAECLSKFFERGQ